MIRNRMEDIFGQFLSIHPLQIFMLRLAEREKGGDKKGKLIRLAIIS